VLGEVTIAGEEAEKLARIRGTVLRTVYVRSGKDMKGAPLELLQFLEPPMTAGAPPPQLTHPGITEVAFWVRDIDKVYGELRAKGVDFYSPPQLFALAGYGKVKAVYFWDPDGTTLELIETLKDLP
jgi:catechol 2,3-dioxygenase-like lactoylglutathione lyase family enzyme